jgi:UDP-N-acetyl-D-glucosamine dehydrogenase
MSDLKAELLRRIASREAKIGIVGLGYVGLPLVVGLANAGFRVVGVDVNAEKVALLQQGRSYIEDVTDGTLAPLVESGLFQATTDYAALADVDAISVCVPTPLRKTRDPDISYIVDAAERIAQLNATGKLLVLESTTYPGTTEEVILPLLSEDGHVAGRDFFLAFSPERIDPGRVDFTLHNTPKVIGGMTPACLEVALALYGTVVENPVPVSSTAAAEMVKLLENTFRAVNIGLVNEIALMCDRLGLDVWEVIQAAATKPYGYMTFYPGPGLGGHCIPIDPLYLSWKLRTLNFTARFIELADTINKQMPEHVVTKIADALNDDGKAVRGSKILLTGVAYKPNVGDTRESPALDIIHLLQTKGAEVGYHDPFVPDLAHEHFDLRSEPLSDAALSNADCVVVVTNHDAVDHDRIRSRARLVVDTRNAVAPGDGARIVKL